MGTKQEKSKVEKKDENVQKAPAKSFVERTQADQPWRNKDGSENRGEVVETEPTIED